MKPILNSVITLVLISGIPLITSAQPYEGAGFTFSYTSGKGDWENFNTVLNEYRNAYPYFTDNGDLSENKYGLSFGFCCGRKEVLSGISGRH